LDKISNFNIINDLNNLLYYLQEISSKIVYAANFLFNNKYVTIKILIYFFFQKK